MTLPNGQSLSLSLAEDAIDFLGSFALSEQVYVNCPGCGDAQPTAYATEELSPAPTLETLSGADGREVLLVERPGVGRALRYVRSGWTVEVLLHNVPETAYAQWSSGLTPVVDGAGWLRLNTSGGLRFGSGGGLNPVVMLDRDEAFVTLVTGTTCSPANDNPTSKCQPSSGVVINGHGNPEVFGRMLSAISVK
jgi:hypothetical protein